MELREYHCEFAEAFAKIRNNAKVLDNGYDKVPSPFTTKDAFDLFKIQLEKKPAQRFLIFSEDVLAGEVGINIKEDVFRLTAEIGYFIAEPFWGRGLATEAIKRMTAYTFQHFDVIRIVAGVFETNKASIRALEKNGYYLESIRKHAVIKNNRIMDDYILVKLKPRKNPSGLINSIQTESVLPGGEYGFL